MQKRLEHTYLYADGHAVQVFSKTDKDAGEIRFVEITEKFTAACCSFEGRLVFSRYDDAIAQLCRRAKIIRAHAADVRHGSENTKRLGIRIGTLEIIAKEGSFRWREMPDCISGAYTYQPEHADAFDPDACSWGNYRVGKIHRITVRQIESGVAA